MARRASKRPSAPSADKPNPWRYAVPLAIAWLVLFAAYYFSRTLPNNAPISRVDLLLLLPDLLKANFVSSDDSIPSGWRYLPQRFELIAVAAFIAIGIWGLGGLLRRLLGMSSESSSGLSRAERISITFGLGAAAWSLVTLLLGLLGWMSQVLFVVLLLAFAASEVVLVLLSRRARETGQASDCLPWLCVVALAAAAPFLLTTALGSMLPPFDFDVKEYHLGGPKEWFLDGRIHFLPHNVYTSFPFLTEMLSLSAMIVRDDWYRGALAGQLLLAGFLPLTALTIFTVARRLFGCVAGVLGALVYVTTPWSYRISIIAYAEGGLTCYVALSLFACLLAVERMRTGTPSKRFVLLAGLFAGSAMACKYPGVIQAVIPIGVALLAAVVWRSKTTEPSDRRGLIQIGALYAVGVLLAVGPWLIKNAIETGNPVYPLMYTVFGGHDWDDGLNAKWKAGHSPPHYDPLSFVTQIGSVVAENDWQSVLVFAFAPLAFLGTNRRAAGYIWLYVAFLYAAWWLLTHRIDRFWIPLLPAACILAGAGAAWAEALPRLLGESALRFRHVWRVATAIAIGCGWLFNLGFISTGLAGNPSFLGDLAAVARTVETPNLAILNRTLPADAKVLLVGEAEIFDARFPVVYNTVFDRNIFEDWFSTQSSKPESDDRLMRPVGEIRERLSDARITHIYVNWREILRYRTTYGFTSFVTPDRFSQMKELGILGEPIVLRTIPLAVLNVSERREAMSRFSGLVRGRGENQTLVAAELYEVEQIGD